MKKNYLLLYVIAILALFVSLPAISLARDGSDDLNDDQTDVSSQEVEDESEDDEDDDSRGGLPRLRDVIRARNGDNEDSRNKLLDRFGTSSKIEIKNIRKEFKEGLKEDREEGRLLVKSATSSKVRKELRKELRRDQFEEHKAILIRQLNLALSNLKQIRDRIAARITKAEDSGRTMIQAKALLEVANAKIAVAEQSIAALVAFSPSTIATTTATTTTATSSPIDLAKPRQVGESAIKAVKEAREALVKVVTAIAHAMGLGQGKNASSTTPTSTTTDTTNNGNNSTTTATGGTATTTSTSTSPTGTP